MYAQAGIIFASSLISYVAAAPAEASYEAMPHLARRQILPWDKSCERTNQYETDGTTYRKRAEKAFNDAATLASWTFHGSAVGGSNFQGSEAYRNYFGPEEHGIQQVKDMMQVIMNNNLPADDRHQDSYKFKVTCGSDQDPKNCRDSALAATGITGDNARMSLCDQFFRKDTPQTKNDLDSKTFPEDPANPGRIPRNGWCQSDKEFDFFEVAGVTILHEMTHLDIVGDKAGLPHDEEHDSHGTDDIYAVGDDDDKEKYDPDSPWGSARTLHQLEEAYKADDTKYKPKFATSRNAESYAASALEFYFITRCGFNEILPHVEYNQ